MVGVMNTLPSFVAQLLQSSLLIAMAPLLMGWIQQNRAWLNNRTGAGLLQPYRNLHKLFLKESVLAQNASPLFLFVPYIYFSIMCLVTAILPVLSSSLPFAGVADIIVLIGLFSLARIFLSLAAMDVGTAFGSMGARREMMIAFLAEPALLMVLFNFALISQSTALSSIVQFILAQPLMISPSIAFAMVAFFMIVLAENSRLPVDNPTTHLELTMIHEALILEYSGRNLAMIEWASDLKLLNYFALAIALFFPWGITNILTISGVLYSLLIFLSKLVLLGSLLAFMEVISAKIRLLRVPEYLTSAFLLAILGVLIQLLVME